MSSVALTTKISPEGLEIANAYFQYGSIPSVSTQLGVAENIISEMLNRREVKQYIDTVYLDTGYRNRFKLADTLDTLIEKKMEEAEESEIYTSKALADLLQMAHKMRIDEMKAQTELEKAKATNIKNQTNIQVNDGGFGQGNYGKLMEKLLRKEDGI